ncbi:hypothetical protein KO566_12645 [Flavobacteriaceae bacterium XHP0103]|uniref:hypothetical protein n=1 Tax=Marixanthotalea marina TaxID=2844359 RepID=UPI002989B413|nr:hypothetical protein [Marixanthotalea marina]MBU3822913.1 hypothetical protein [Marixanthotalea marina]
MKNKSIIIILLFFISCGNEKIVQLPEIEHSDISEVNDISAAYIFYDETQTDSVELNRKNLISTTNWLVNVDKRLTLKQAIPQIILLQDKRRNAQMHKNENAKNYYTCNNTSKKTLGFIDFTEVVYHEDSSESYISNIPEIKNAANIKSMSFNLDGTISIIDTNTEPFISTSSKNKLINDLKKGDTIKGTFLLNFNKNLSFQDYISYKSMLSTVNFKHLNISNQEFLHN